MTDQDPYGHPNLLVQDALQRLNTVAVDAEVLQDRWGLDASALLRATNTAKKAALKLAQPVKERTQ